MRLCMARLRQQQTAEMGDENKPASDELSEKELLQQLLTEVNSLRITQTSLAGEVAAIKAGNQQSSSTTTPVSVSDNRPDHRDLASSAAACAHPRSSDGTPLACSNATNSGNIGPLVPSLGDNAANDTTGSDLESQYWALVKDVKLKDVRLTPTDILKDNHKGFKKEHKTASSIITRSARYIETGLKVLYCCEASPEVTDLAVVLRAHLEFLKSEYACLVVANDNTKEVAQNYRRIKSGTTGMSSTDLQDLKLAQEITAHNQAASQDRDRHDRDHYRGGRGGQQYRGRQFNYRGRGGRDRQDYGTYHNFIRSNDQLPNSPQSRNDD